MFYNYTRALFVTTIALLTATVPYVAAVAPAKARNVSFVQGEKLKQLCKTTDSNRVWMLLGYLAGVLDKTSMDGLLGEVVGKANDVHPETTNILVASVVGYCLPENFSLADAHRAICTYMDMKPDKKFDVGPEWVQAALRRAYPCTK